MKRKTATDPEVLARRVYDMHRDRDVKRGRNRDPIPTWDQLTADRRAELVDRMGRLIKQYRSKTAKETRIGPNGT